MKLQNGQGETKVVESVVETLGIKFDLTNFGERLELRCIIRDHMCGDGNKQNSATVGPMTNNAGDLIWPPDIKEYVFSPISNTPRWFIEWYACWHIIKAPGTNLSKHWVLAEVLFVLITRHGYIIENMIPLMMENQLWKRSKKKNSIWTYVKKRKWTHADTMDRIKVAYPEPEPKKVRRWDDIAIDEGRIRS